jgi:DivIVA domain-containing protein
VQPEDIEGREFFVGLRGYDKDEVNAFLTEVAAELRSLQDELDEVRAGGGSGRGPAEARDDFEDLGANVAAILRTAKESASAMVTDAEGQAAQIRADAEAYAEARRQAADEYAESKRHEGDEAHAQATQRANEAQEHANRLVHDAEERARIIVADGEARARQQVEALVADAAGRLAETSRRSEELRARLAETADELQLAVMALGEPTGDPEGAVRAAVSSATDHANNDG